MKKIIFSVLFIIVNLSMHARVLAGNESNIDYKKEGVTLTEFPFRLANSIPDSSFEGNWTVSGANSNFFNLDGNTIWRGFPFASFEKNTSNAHTGNSSMLVSYTSYGSGTPSIRTDYYPFVPAGTYKFGFWYKTSTDQGSQNLSIRFGNGTPGAYTALTTETATLSSNAVTGFEYAEVEFTAPTDMNEFRIDIFIPFLSVSDFIYFDDFILDIPSNPQVINFDTEFADNPAYNGQEMKDKLEAAILAADNGGEIIFTARTYNIERRVVVDKAVTFTGVGSLPNPSNAGAGTINTIFIFNQDNNNGFSINSDGVVFKNIQIQDNFSGNRAMSFSDAIVQNIILENMDFVNWEYVLFANNGVGMQLSNSNLNFGFRGYGTNRNQRIAITPQAIIDKCIFTPVVASRMNMRAISIDAGNDEYPAIWDQSNSQIINSVFQDAGFASSKCSNFVINGNTFNKTVFFDEIIHLEEFSEDVEVTNNTFLFNQEGEVMGTGNIQACKDVLLSNNTVIGPIKFLAQGAETIGIQILNNNVSQAIQDPSRKMINYYGACGHRNVTISGNGITDEILVTYESGYLSGIQINEPQANVERRLVPGCPPIIANGRYFIENQSNNELLTAQSGSVNVSASSAESLNTSWDITYVWPRNYEIKNVATGNYLEVKNGPLGQDVTNQNFRDIVYAEQKSYNELERKPIWVFNSESGGNYSFLSGGGQSFDMLEYKSSLDLFQLVLGVESDRRTFKPRIPENLFQFRLSTLSIDKFDVKNSIIVYPNPVKESLFIKVDANAVGSVKGTLYDITGKAVRKLVLASGTNLIDTKDLKPGLYMLELRLNSIKSTKKIIKL